MIGIALLCSRTKLSGFTNDLDKTTRDNAAPEAAASFVHQWISSAPCTTYCVLEFFLEKIMHCPPRPFLGLGIVGATVRGVACTRVGKAVHRTTIDDKLPINVRVAHFLRKFLPLGRRDNRIVGTVERENVSLDVAVILWRGRSQIGMEHDDCFNVRTTPS